MKLEQLKALDAVVKAGSFAKAAHEILQVTQPAVTRAVQNLEAEIGFTLFSRAGYRPVLTPEGQAFYAKAQQILQDVQALCDFSAQLAVGVEPHLHIAVDAYFLLPQVLQAFHGLHIRYPETQLHMRSELMGASLRRLMSGDADLAIVPWYAEYANMSVRSQILARVQASTVVSHDFPLLGREHITPADLAPYIQVIERTEALPGLASTSPLHPHSPHWYVHDVHTKKQVILSGGTYGLLPYHLITTELAEGRLVPLANLVGFQVHSIELRAVCRQDREMGPALTALWQLLLK